MYHPAHKAKGVNRTRTMRFHPFVFTGKERDEETGYGYFGARYMDHELMTGWLSVDPMADKYPSISPYAYCAWNPVKLVDPDGRDGIPIINKKRKTITIKVDLIFYMVNPGHIGRKKIDQWINQFKSDIEKEWVSRSWTYNYNGETYSVDFDFTYRYDHSIHGQSDFHYDKEDNSKNYIEISGVSANEYDSRTRKYRYVHRSSVKTNRKAGKWHYDMRAAAHEVGHLLYLPDRYHEDNQSESGYSPDLGWKGTVMAEPGQRGHVTQKDVNEVLDKMLKNK